MSLAPERATTSRILPRWLTGGNWSLRIGLFCFALIVLAAIFAPFVTAFDPLQLDLRNALKPPSLTHLLGTDHLGRDVFSRVVYAARVDLQIGAIGWRCRPSSAPLSPRVGLLRRLGRCCRRPRRRRHHRLPSSCWSSPSAMLGPGLVNLYIALTMVSWVLYTRIVRAEALALKKREYAGRAQSRLRASAHHAAPHPANAVAPAFVFAMSDFALDVRSARR